MAAVPFPPPASEPPPSPPPSSGRPAGDQSSEFVVTMIRRSRVNGIGSLTDTTTGGAKVVAAWLRAYADEIDPRRPVMRGSVGVAQFDANRLRQSVGLPSNVIVDQIREAVRRHGPQVLGL